VAHPAPDVSLDDTESDLHTYLLASHTLHLHSEILIVLCEDNIL